MARVAVSSQPRGDGVMTRLPSAAPLGAEFVAFDVDAEQVDLVDAPLAEEVFQSPAGDEDLFVVRTAPLQT
ncbi:hypothetical protein ACTMS0_03405 [Micromonospora sp. H33]|uniref:hypothetical protein n=1 Tax=Micromonospora sp. H33 TaxID=3452215 RepID=UPI003F890D62